jgi:hypothetical protein
MADFARASAVDLVGDGVFRAEIPDGWQQGRGAFGGLVLATMLRAIERSERDGARATRTLSGDLCGPVLPGVAAIRVRELRRGANQSNFAAELVQHGEVQATCTAVLSAARRVTMARPPLDPPAPQDWQAVPVFALAPPDAPVFTPHYEYRSQLGRGESRELIIDGWIRERSTLAALDAPAMIGRLDAWWPTAFGLDARPRPMATVSFTAEMLADPASLDPAQPLRYRSRMAGLHEGFFVELRELWQADRPVALNQQTFVVIK